MKKIVPINEFANKCNYFTNEYLKNDIDINNGYNCDHTDQEEYEIVDGKKIGKCFAWSCPLCSYANEESFNDKNINNNCYEYEENEFVIIGR